MSIIPLAVSSSDQESDDDFAEIDNDFDEFDFDDTADDSSKIKQEKKLSKISIQKNVGS